MAATDKLNEVLALREGEPASVTVTVMEKAPVVVGVPEMIPLLVRVSPAGSAPADQV